MKPVRVGGKALQEHELECPDCGDSMALLNDRYGTRYRCRDLECKGAHGAHPDGRPLGEPVDAATRKARIEAHDAFDRIWRAKRMSRSAAYAWMRSEFSLSEEEAHIGKFPAITCRQLVLKVKNSFPELFPFDD